MNFECKLLIFDCDGVLIDSEDLSDRVQLEVFKEMGITVDPVIYAKRFPGVTTENSMRTVFAENGIQLNDNWINAVEKKITQTLINEVTVTPYIIEFLSQTTKPKAVASNSKFTRLNQVLSNRGIAQYFGEHIYSFDMVARPKPYPDLYLFVAQKFGYLPSDCLVIEDSTTGVQAAVSAGMSVLGFTGNHKHDTDLGQKLLDCGAKYVFNSMSELSSLIR